MIALQRPLEAPMTDLGVQDLVNGLEYQNISAIVSISRDTSSTPRASVSINARRTSTSSSGSHLDTLDRSKKKIHPKVRTGCDTCKRRKIKCDEGKPWCLRCVKSGRKCDGYHPPQIKLFEPLAKPNRHEVVSEERSFDYYMNETSLRMAGYRPIQLPTSFWRELCPRMASTLPAVRSALIALGATSEKYEAKYLRKASAEEVKERTMFALEQYTRALHQLSLSIGSSSISTESTLVCCLLLTACDFWHTGLPITLHHSYAGLRICRTMQNSGQKLLLDNALEVDSHKLFPAFVHLADCATISGDESDPEKAFLVSQFADTAELIAPQQFFDLHEAFAAMDRLIRQLAKIVPPGNAQEITRLQDYLSEVVAALHENLSNAKADGDMPAVFGFRSLLVHHRVACIMLNTTATEDEFIYDNYVDDFDYIVSEMECLLRLRAPDGSLQIESIRVWLGVIPPLFFAATKCRDSAVRHRAIKALHITPHTERMWTTCTASQIAQELIWLEESGIAQEECVDALSGPRVNLLNIGFDIANSKITLAYERQNIRGPRFATSTISWSKGGDMDAFYIPQMVDMPQKQVRVASYAPIIMTFRGIDCHCGDCTSPTEHNVLLRSTLD